MIPNAEQLRDAYQKAPPLVQEYITSPELSSTFTTIRETHKLHLDEAEQLSNALNAVFLELAPYEKFPALLKEALEQNASQYDAVLKAVNEDVFAEFRKKLTAPQETPAPQPNPSVPFQSRKAVEQTSAEPAPEARTVPNKLDSSVRNVPQEIEIKTEPQKNASYSTGVDPYREPIQ